MPVFNPANVLLMNARTGNVPSEQGTLILRNIIGGSVVMQLAQYEAMTKPKKTFNYLSGGIGAYWVNEAEVIQTSKPTWLTAEMEAKKVAVILPVSKEFLQFSVADFFDQMKAEVSEAFYNKFDQAALWGNDSPYAAGQSIWADIVASGHTVAKGSLAPGGTLYDELNAVMGLVEDNDGDPNGWMTIKSNNQMLRGVKDSQGNPMFTTATAGTPPNLLGEAVGYAKKEAWDRTKAEMLTGDWKFARYGILNDIEYSISEEATISSIVDAGGKPINLWERDLVAMKATMMIGFMRLKEGNFAALTPTPAGP